MSDVLERWFETTKTKLPTHCDGGSQTTSILDAQNTGSLTTKNLASSKLSNEQALDSSILALILANGRIGTLIADRLIAAYGSLAVVISTPALELLRFGGLTKTQVLTIKAVQDAALRLVSSDLNTESLISDRDALYNYLVAHYSRISIEVFRVLFLSSSNRLIADEALAHGTINQVCPYPREIIKRTIELNASALILVHNHPSGDPSPSIGDIDSTILIRDIAAALQITVHDHIIIARGRMVSFRELGLLH